MQDWLEPFAGGIVLAITLLDVFLTVLYARAGTGLLAPAACPRRVARLPGTVRRKARRHPHVLRSRAAGRAGADVGRAAGARLRPRDPSCARHRRQIELRRDRHRFRHRVVRRRQQHVDRRRQRLRPDHRRLQAALPVQFAGGHVGDLAHADLPDAGLLRPAQSQHVGADGARRRAARPATPRNCSRAGAHGDASTAATTTCRRWPARSPRSRRRTISIRCCSTSASKKPSTRCRASC